VHGPADFLSSFGGTRQLSHNDYCNTTTSIDISNSPVFTTQSTSYLSFLNNTPRTLNSSTQPPNVSDTFLNLHHNNLLPIPPNLPNGTHIPLLPPTLRPLLRRRQNNIAPKSLNPTGNTESDVQGREGDGFRFGEGWDSGSAGGSTEAWEEFGEERGVEWIVGQR